MEQFNILIKQELATLDLVIRRDLASQIPLINTVGEYIIAGGGKRLRPLLTILVAKLFKNEEPLVYKMAAMIEYIHTATLLHDDVVDESGMRRGRQTANAVFGNAASVLVGDFIYTRAFQMMVHSNSLRVLQIMADSTNVISEGEVLQLLSIGRSDLTKEEYFKVIESKTAKLFEAAVRVAAIISNVDIQTEQKLANYAIYLGSAFQIMDDILDYTGTADSLGKNIGDDLIEGKVTLPLIYLLMTGSAEVKQLIKAAIDKPKSAELNKIIELVVHSNALSYCEDIANQYVRKAQAELVQFPDSVYKQALIYLLNAAVKRAS